MKYLIYIVLVPFLFGCVDGVPPLSKPKDCIPKEKMITILSEIVVMESHVQMEYIQLPKYYEALAVTGDSILKSKGCTSHQFIASLDYYGSEQDEMIAIYQAVIDTLEIQKKSLE